METQFPMKKILPCHNTGQSSIPYFITDSRFYAVYCRIYASRDVYKRQADPQMYSYAGSEMDGKTHRI